MMSMAWEMNPTLHICSLNKRHRRHRLELLVFELEKLVKLISFECNAMLHATAYNNKGNMFSPRRKLSPARKLC